MTPSRFALMVTLTLGLLAAPLAAGAQPAGKVYRIGCLSVSSPAMRTSWEAAFREGLRELGYLEGQNLILELRSAEGQVARLPELATDLVSLRVGILFVNGLLAARAAKQATSTIPIVVGAVGDAVECGLVASLARPGGNLTGGSWVGNELIGKQLELLKEIRPKLSRLGMLWNPDTCVDHSQLRELQAAARTLKVQVQALAVRTREDVAHAFKPLADGRAEALVVTGGSASYWHRRVLIERAIRQRLPVVGSLREFADDGALLTHGANLPAMTRYATTYVDKILKGAKPADLPMERPTKFELVINLKTAKALGLTISPSVLARADEIIQ